MARWERGFSPPEECRIAATALRAAADPPRQVPDMFTHGVVIAWRDYGRRLAGRGSLSGGEGVASVFGVVGKANMRGRSRERWMPARGVVG